VPIAEALHLRPSGRSGKDTVVNMMEELLAGSYAYSINYQALCEPPAGDGPSQSLSLIRARRIVSIRETPTGEKHKIRSDIYKRIVDPSSKIVARPLYGSNIVFSPQHLAIFCSNGPSHFDVEDEVVKARMAIVDHTQIFVDTPTEANHSQRLDLSRGVLARDYRVGTFWLLQRVYRHLLHDRVERNVRPMTEQSLEARDLDCGGKDLEWWPEFLSKFEPAAPRQATPAAEIEAQVVKLGVAAKEVRLFLQGKGVDRERRVVGRTNVWLCRYMFPSEDGRRLAFVRLR
jgi:hypothetical protein